MSIEDTVNVRYMVDDVASAIDFYTTHFGFEAQTTALPAFADVTRGQPTSPAEWTGELRRPPDARRCTTSARRVEPCPLHHHGPRRRDRTAPNSRSPVPQRRRLGAGRAPDSPRGPIWKPHRTLPASGELGAPFMR